MAQIGGANRAPVEHEKIVGIVELGCPQEGHVGEALVGFDVPAGLHQQAASGDGDEALCPSIIDLGKESGGRFQVRLAYRYRLVRKTKEQPREMRPEAPARIVERRCPLDGCARECLESLEI